jgi:hypothetical protein
MWMGENAEMTGSWRKIEQLDFIQHWCECAAVGEADRRETADVLQCLSSVVKQWDVLAS